MNKKQLAVAWVMGIVFCIIAFDKGFIKYKGLGRPIGAPTFNPVIGIGIPILIIGSLLIYTFKKK